MTYYNIAFRTGRERFASSLAASGRGRAPSCPTSRSRRSGPWADAADAAGVETVLLAAPTAPDERLPRVCARARGFVYAVGLLGVTGERDALAASAVVIARRLKAVTDKPVLVGVGVSDADAGASRCARRPTASIGGVGRAPPARRRPRGRGRLRGRGPRRHRRRRARRDPRP